MGLCVGLSKMPFLDLEGLMPAFVMKSQAGRYACPVVVFRWESPSASHEVSYPKNFYPTIAGQLLRKAHKSCWLVEQALPHFCPILFACSESESAKIDNSWWKSYRVTPKEVFICVNDHSCYSTSLQLPPNTLPFPKANWPLGFCHLQENGQTWK